MEQMPVIPSPGIVTKEDYQFNTNTVRLRPDCDMEQDHVSRK